VYHAVQHHRAATTSLFYQAGRGVGCPSFPDQKPDINAFPLQLLHTRPAGKVIGYGCDQSRTVPHAAEAHQNGGNRPTALNGQAETIDLRSRPRVGINFE
jgi:hypothetical protein